MRIIKRRNGIKPMLLTPADNMERLSHLFKWYDTSYNVQPSNSLQRNIYYLLCCFSHVSYLMPRHWLIPSVDQENEILQQRISFCDALSGLPQNDFGFSISLLRGSQVNSCEDIVNHFRTLGPNSDNWFSIKLNISFKVYFNWWIKLKIILKIKQ